MSVWSHITGVINLDASVTEDDLLNIYGRTSHKLVGSEGGLNISFTRTQRKNWSSSSEKDYNVEPFTRISNMVLQGNLRDFDEQKLEAALEALKEFLYELKVEYVIRSASFILECDTSENYYHLAFVKDRVRTKKVTIKTF